MGSFVAFRCCCGGDVIIMGVEQEVFQVGTSSAVGSVYICCDLCHFVSKLVNCLLCKF